MSLRNWICYAVSLAAMLPPTPAWTTGACGRLAALGIVPGAVYQRVKTRPDLHFRGEEAVGERLAVRVGNHKGLQGLLLVEGGKVRRFIPGVITGSSWNPDGTAVAYLQAGDDARGTEYRRPERVAVWRVEDDAATSITELGRTWLVDLQWAVFDSSIYVHDLSHADSTVVYRVDTEAQRLVPTAYKGIHFSPNGDYCFRPPHDGGPFIVYNSRTGKEVWAYGVNRDVTFEVPNPMGGWFYFLGWHVNARGETFFYIKDDFRAGRANVGILNCETGDFRVVLNPGGESPSIANGMLVWQ